MKRREMRFDTIPPYGKLTSFVTPQAAHEYLTGQQTGAEEARLRMLQRLGLDREDNSAADARDAMIRRREHREE